MAREYIYTEKLAVGYGKTPLIENIALRVRRGQIVTLIGPNGAGKSTILKSIIRQLRILGGTVILDGASLEKMTERELARKMSVMMTERIRPDLMTCRDVVSAGRYPYTGRLGILSPEDEKKVDEALALVHAGELAGRLFSEISDGQRQRILLARAICQEPEVIVLDEPTSFLDVRHKLELLAILKELVRERQVAVLMSLHELELAQKISDYIVCVREQAIGRCGTPEEKRCFSWNAKLGRDHYYLQIARSLIDRIGTGFYRDGSFLPSEAALAAEYGVSVSTIRKALAMLNRLGFCRTYNVKGTQVTLFNDEATFYALKNRVHKRETLLYLSGLQFMTLAAGPAAKLAFSGISGTELLRLKEKMEQPLSIPLDVLIRCVIRYLPLEPYRVILQEVSDILHWGYYYSFYEGGARSANELNNRALNAFALLEEGRRDAFAGELSGCFGHALEMVRDAMVEFGLLEAANLVTPKPQ